MLYRGEKVEVSLAQADPRPRSAGHNIVNPITDEVDRPREGADHGRHRPGKIEEMGIERIQVRSPMTCEADARHVPALLRDGPLDRSAGRRRPRRRGSSPPSRSGSPVRSSRCERSTSGVSPSSDTRRERSADAKAGTRRSSRAIRSVVNTEGQDGRARSRNGEIVIIDPEGPRAREVHDPDGAVLSVVKERRRGQGRPGALRVGPSLGADPRGSRR